MRQSLVSETGSITASYPGQFALSELPEEDWDRVRFPTNLRGDVTSEIAEDDWERGWFKQGRAIEVGRAIAEGQNFTRLAHNIKLRYC